MGEVIDFNGVTVTSEDTGAYPAPPNEIEFTLRVVNGRHRITFVDYTVTGCQFTDSKVLVHLETVVKWQRTVEIKKRGDLMGMFAKASPSTLEFW